MVSALCRHLPNEIILNENIPDEVGQAEINCLLLPTDDEKFPCALREFINSNADLPTIEELVKKSTKLAEAIGMLS